MPSLLTLNTFLSHGLTPSIHQVFHAKNIPTKSSVFQLYDVAENEYENEDVDTRFFISNQVAKGLTFKMV